MMPECFAYALDDIMTCASCGLVWKTSDAKPMCRLPPEANYYEGPVDLVYVQRRSGWHPRISVEKWPKDTIEATFKRGALPTDVWPVLQRTRLSDEEAKLSLNELMVKYPLQTGANRSATQVGDSGKAESKAGD